MHFFFPFFFFVHVGDNSWWPQFYSLAVLAVLDWCSTVCLWAPVRMCRGLLLYCTSHGDFVQYLPEVVYVVAGGLLTDVIPQYMGFFHFYSLTMGLCDPVKPLLNHHSWRCLMSYRGMCVHKCFANNKSPNYFRRSFLCTLLKLPTPPSLGRHDKASLMRGLSISPA